MLSYPDTKMKRILAFFKRNEGFRGGIVFIVLLLAGCWILNQKDVTSFIESKFTKSISYIASFLLNSVGLNVVAVGIKLSGHGLNVDIKYGCNAIYEIMVFSSAVIAYPIRLKDKIVGLIIGTVSIYSLNMVRVLFLFISGIYFPRIFKVTHEHIAQNIFIFLLVVLWISWVLISRRTTTV